MRKAPPLPTAIDDYRKWWNSVDQQKLIHEQATNGYQVLSNAVRLQEGLQNIWPQTQEEEQMRDYILRDYTWPISDQLVPPDTLVEQAVIADWWANRRERLTSKCVTRKNAEKLNDCGTAAQPLAHQRKSHRAYRTAAIYSDSEREPSAPISRG